MERVDSKQILKMISNLNESQTRWYVAREARVYGRGGIKKMNEITGISRTTIIKGIKELKNKTLGTNERLINHFIKLRKNLKESDTILVIGLLGED